MKVRKTDTFCLPYVKGLAKKIQKICGHKSTKQYSKADGQYGEISVDMPNIENITKNRVYSTPCNCRKKYKSETIRPLKVRLEEHRIAVIRGETVKLVMADHVWK